MYEFIEKTNIYRQPIPDSIEKFVVQAAVLIATHQVLPFDMAIMDACDGQRIFSFLSLEWAIIADVDCDSEKYRYLVKLNELQLSSLFVLICFSFQVKQDLLLKPSNEFFVSQMTIIERIRYFFVLEPRVYRGYIDYLPYDANDGIASTNPTTASTTTAQLYQHLIPINEPISIDPSSSKWRRIDGPFAHVLITSKSALSRDVLSTPQSTLADGYLTLQFIRSAGLSRVNLAKTFLSLSDGTHLDYDFVEHIPIRAFRIVPEGTEGNLMVDGEKVPYGKSKAKVCRRSISFFLGPIQGEILPSFARCMGKEPKNDQTE